ncbi:MAG: hypothetical protein A3J69_02850 [Candidatus Levybacteria bacterium RIFCSPHIGHO2_02_FULL_42_12]|nr:MAG: hypothetical protein A2698_02175 [Candidatus Levybacteria bacterium RIFCSPHIGHO2_01_FULL_42_15]OGH34002.1 MAG: hypothetical protein A3J69_02850 [Candidatus Levybacteria bacterium RIFCSPHIGHO2_02_FULL_42_12]OGH42817.1 MAG: hypothetical protein A3B53_00190 [Candidatus Levybacteria bacterium RIFCSPLOWO2_01_FULL_42_15]
MVRVRIAPSPTGFAHVGNAYAALFNYAFAKQHNGVFVLRFEDSDVKRNVKGAEEAIFDGLKWLGLTWDEGTDVGGSYGPYRLSERLDIYNQKAQELVKMGKAYEDKGAIRFKDPHEEISWIDHIRGKISFPPGEITDFVMIKSDGFPTYSFAVCVDDILMKITHVIRGEEHISNTPRQLAIYKSFGVKPPEFAHFPTLRNAQHQKLSKRRDPVNLKLYKDEGYLPEALINFLCLLGWSHPEEKEIFTLEEFIKKFSLDRVKKAGPVFDIKKLEWMNGMYIRQAKLDELSEKLKVQSFDKAQDKNEKFKNIKDEEFRKIVAIAQSRIKTLNEFSDLVMPFVEGHSVLLTDQEKAVGKDILSSLSSVSSWDKETVFQAIRCVLDAKGARMSLAYKIFTGKEYGLPLADVLEVFGKDKALSFLQKIIS